MASALFPPLEKEREREAEAREAKLMCESLDLMFKLSPE